MVKRQRSVQSSNALTGANLLFHLFRKVALPLLPDEAARPMRPPVVIGGHGGSGTRVLPPALRLAGFWMGSWVNPKTEDAMATRFFLQRYFEQAIGQRFDGNPELERAFRGAVRSHRLRMPDPAGPWGWKNPRSMWVIPFLTHLFPDMTFIHLVRDGRDVALSSNLNLLRKHGAMLLGEEHPEQDPVGAQLRLWALGNQTAADDGERLLGGNYLRLSYEAMCAAPRETLARMYEHLQQPVTATLLDRAERLVVPSRSIGAWRESDCALLHEPDTEIATALRRFGYRTDDPAPRRAVAADSERALGRPAA